MDKGLKTQIIISISGIRNRVDISKSKLKFLKKK